VPNSKITLPAALNDSNQVTGRYVLGNNSFHGFLRNQDGTITLFDVPNTKGTFPLAIDQSGFVAGSANIRDMQVFVGFIRDPLGNITTLAARPGATFPRGINASGEMVGNFASVPKNTNFGFRHDINGSVSLFRFQRKADTIPQAINSAGWVTGWYLDE